MADYYSILKKTIASLPESNGAARRSVYSRARNAIVNQLKAYEPPLSPSEITAEQLRLEEAIRKVEAEAARESLGLTPAAVAAAPAVEAPDPAPQPDEPPVAEASVAADPVPDDTAVDESRDLRPTDEVTPEPAPESASEFPDDIPSPLQETLTEAESLGSAANQAVQQAKEAVEPAASAAQVGSEPRQEPVFGQTAPSDDGLFEDENKTGAGEEVPGSAQDAAPSTPAKMRAKRERPSASDALRSSSSSSRIVPIALALILVVALLGAGAYYFLPLDDLVSINRQDTEPGTPQAENTVPSNAPVATPDTGQVSDDDSSSKNTDRLLDDGENEVIAPDARTVTTTTINPETNEPVTAPAQPPITPNAQEVPALIQPETPQPGEAAPPSGAETNAPAAVPQDNLAAIEPETATQEDQPAGLSGGDGVAQRSILYEEGEDAGGAGTASQGAVVWGVAEETNLDGRQQSVLTASIDIPERDVKVDIRIKPNDDTSLPASHLVEIKYNFPDSFAAGDVVNVPGLVMKPTEEARGDALIGASVKVQPGFFWIALSSLPNEQQRNLALLRERGWIDIPMLYENGKRGILTLEKGAVGADAVERAVSAWQAG
ncbi:hypothetical protein [uncultured Roseibium sp.]|uniref:hypothetical protein n=1 Tax=uncultured Roseibium sp. TaxID=1936171 RepID=UPI002637FB33|nr:hypothetical protein [uncultured Roseibium sp.]